MTRLGLPVRGETRRTDERLPLARRARVARDVGVREETELAAEGRLDLADVRAVAGEERALEERLNEELRVERAGGRVERRAGDRRVDLVLGGDGVRGEEVDDLDGGEARVAHAREDLVVVVRRLGHEQVGGGARDVGPACEELEAGTACAVGDTDGASELDAIFELTS